MVQVSCLYLIGHLTWVLIFERVLLDMLVYTAFHDGCNMVFYTRQRIKAECIAEMMVNE